MLPIRIIIVFNSFKSKYNVDYFCSSNSLKEININSITYRRKEDIVYKWSVICVRILIQIMPLLLDNIRFLTRFVRTNTSTTTSQVPIVTKPNHPFIKIGAVAAGIFGLYYLMRASRKEEQLIEHTADRQNNKAPMKN